MLAPPLLSLALFATTAAPAGVTAVDSAAVYADTLPDAWAPHEWVAADAVPPALVPAADGNSSVHLLTRTLTFTLGGTLGVHFPAGAPNAAFTLGGLELRNDRDSLISAVYPAADAPASDGYALRVPTAGAYTLMVYAHPAKTVPSSAPTAVRFTLTAPLPDAVAAPHLTAPHSRANTTYDLSGRRVTTTAPRGIVIRGGQKIMR
jgi:hypothetical protein